LFEGKIKEEPEALARTFAFENYVKTDGLNAILLAGGKKKGDTQP
jgi:hypothetical protein